MEIRLVNWNLNCFRRLTGQALLIGQLNCDLVTLQEVTEQHYQNLVNTNLFDWSVFSLTLRPPKVDEGKARRLGCAIFGKKPFCLSSYHREIMGKVLEKANVAQDQKCQRKEL